MQPERKTDRQTGNECGSYELNGKQRRSLHVQTVARGNRYNFYLAFCYIGIWLAGRQLKISAADSH